MHIGWEFLLPSERIGAKTEIGPHFIARYVVGDFRISTTLVPDGRYREAVSGKQRQSQG